MGHDIRVNWFGFLLNPYKNFEGVYALYDKKDNLLYIGETMDFKTRMINHMTASQFNYMIHKVVFYQTDLLSRKEIEFILIDLCKPIFNNQLQGKFMKSRRHELIRDLTLPEYKCKCSACYRPRLRKYNPN